VSSVGRARPLFALRLCAPVEADLQAQAAEVARNGAGIRVIHLEGELGTGKTSWARAYLRARGIEGPVRSPTFTLVETYLTREGAIYHLDLYRLADPEEIEYLGLRDLASEDTGTLLIEWPERAVGRLPSPELRVLIDPASRGRTVQYEFADRDDFERLRRSLEFSKSNEI